MSRKIVRMAHAHERSLTLYLGLETRIETKAHHFEINQSAGILIRDRSIKRRITVYSLNVLRIWERLRCLL